MAYKDFKDYSNFEDVYLDGYYYGYKQITHLEKTAKLNFLIKQLEIVDKKIDKILNEKVSLNQLIELNTLLKQGIEIKSGMMVTEFSLIDRKNLERAFYSSDLYDTMLDVRRGSMKFPAYYLCEARSNHFGNYGIITAEYFCSSNYKFNDSRFARLMHFGHEKYFIRMSQFREAATEALKEEGKVDNLLYDIGVYFLQSAWHEDQVIGWMVSGHFNLPQFREAIELIYFNLGSDFCEVRERITGDVKLFFKKIYPRAALVKMITKIENSDGNEFQAIEMKSRHWYMELSKAFNELLQCKIEWGMMEKKKVPLYKVVFSNIYRLEKITKDIYKGNPKIAQSCKRLEETAKRGIEAILL
ncbi:MAG: hypothetical protein K8R53_13550 [Bacteroidales bacterium]|nr:hypothetical protein [Bacteroidales bacterium]